jgi:tetrahydromethanopterin S-methyltransferase subunit G
VEAETKSRRKQMSIGTAIGTILGAVLGLAICLAIYYWHKENEE